MLRETLEALASAARVNARDVVGVKRIGVTDYVLTLNSGRKAYAIYAA